MVDRRPRFVRLVPQRSSGVDEERDRSAFDPRDPEKSLDRPRTEAVVQRNFFTIFVNQLSKTLDNWCGFAKRKTNGSDRRNSYASNGAIHPWESLIPGAIAAIRGEQSAVAPAPTDPSSSLDINVSKRNSSPTYFLVARRYEFRKMNHPPTAKFNAYVSLIFLSFP